MTQKYFFDLIFSLLCLLILLPFFVIVGIWIKLDSPGPVFFRQLRVGRFGNLFYIYKFRTMYLNTANKGILITVANDPRVSRSGRFLRKFKIDEFPQLINVILGEMSLVGPRPEVPFYMEHCPEEIKKIILSIRPGITDYASIIYIDEQMTLAKAEDPNMVYIEKIMPVKWDYHLNYVGQRSMWIDFKIIISTIKAIYI